MAENRAGRYGPVSSMIEFSSNVSTDKQRSVHQMPRHDVLQYIQEMCATLSYLSIANIFRSCWPRPVVKRNAIWQASRIVSLNLGASIILMAFAKRPGERRDAQDGPLATTLARQSVHFVH
jgi:hypothetical protein